MKNIIFFICLTLFPVFGFSQKAYESVYYKGSTQNIKVTFNLADGYFGASEIVTRDKKTKKISKFIPEDGVALPNEKMKFIHYSVSGKTFTDYFILEGLGDAEQYLPEKIKGKYYFKGTGYLLVLLRK